MKLRQFIGNGVVRVLDGIDTVFQAQLLNANLLPQNLKTFNQSSAQHLKL